MLSWCFPTQRFSIRSIFGGDTVFSRKWPQRLPHLWASSAFLLTSIILIISMLNEACLSGRSLVTSEACLSASGAVHPAVSKFITVISLRPGEAGTGWAWGVFPADIPGETENLRLQMTSQEAAQRSLHVMMAPRCCCCLDKAHTGSFSCVRASTMARPVIGEPFWYTAIQVSCLQRFCRDNAETIKHRKKEEFSIKSTVFYSTECIYIRVCLCVWGGHACSFLFDLVACHQINKHQKSE